MSVWTPPVLMEFVRFFFQPLQSNTDILKLVTTSCSKSLPIGYWLNGSWGAGHCIRTPAPYVTVPRHVTQKAKFETKVS